MTQKNLKSLGVSLTLIMLAGLVFLIVPAQAQTFDQTPNAGQTTFQGQMTHGLLETQYPWRGVAYDQAATAYTPSPGPQSPHLLWKTSTGTANAPFVFSIADGMVFTRNVFDGVVYALDAKTGEIVWQTQVGRAKSPEAVVYYDGHIYTDADNYSLVRLDAASGALCWKYYFPPELVLATGNNTEYRVNMPLVCGNDIIYVGVGDTLFCLQDQYDHCCWADMIEPFQDVKVLWTYTLPKPSSCGWGGFHSPTLIGDKLYESAFTGDVYCFNATTGAIIWTYTIPESPVTMLEQVSVSDGYAVLPSYGNLICLNATTGTQVWTALNGTLPSSVAIHNGRVFLYDNPGKFYCFDLATGAKVWDFTPKNNSASYYYPTLADGNVYITASFVDPSVDAYTGLPTLNAWVQCLDEQTGTLKWEAQLDPGPYKKGYGACVGATAVADGNWYIHNGANGYMY